MSFLLRKKYKDETIFSEYDIFTDNLYVIEDYGGNVIGYIEYIDHGSSWEIEMIEVLEKGLGHGNAIIKWIFENYNLLSMSGEILIDWDMVAYKFWNSLGADIELSEEEALELVDGVYFWLDRNSVLK